MKNKTLLIFFGELRTFEFIVPQLERLNEVDVVISTWKSSRRNDSTFLVDENFIKQILPNIKHICIEDSNNVIEKLNIPQFDRDDIHRFNSKLIFWHWKNAIDKLENLNEYENIIIHRCDLISNWHEMLDLDMEDSTIYVHYDENICYFKEFPEIFWVNDYHIFGKSDIVKKFVNLLNEDCHISMDSHSMLSKTLIDNNIQYKKHILRGGLIRDNDIDYVKKYNKENKIIPNMGFILSPSDPNT